MGGGFNTHLMRVIVCCPAIAVEACQGILRINDTRERDLYVHLPVCLFVCLFCLDLPPSLQVCCKAWVFSPLQSFGQSTYSPTEMTKIYLARFMMPTIEAIHPNQRCGCSSSSSSLSLSFPFLCHLPHPLSSSPCDPLPPKPHLQPLPCGCIAIKRKTSAPSGGRPTTFCLLFLTVI
jgi:hypothetical protein